MAQRRIGEDQSYPLQERLKRFTKVLVGRYKFAARGGHSPKSTSEALHRLRAVGGGQPIGSPDEHTANVRHRRQAQV
jgi:hypothetical protein